MSNNNNVQWASRLGFILATAGSAIGLGNLWKFPYLMGQNGGFWFLIVYLVFICVLGLPVMIMEMSLGRKTGSNPIDAYGKTVKHAKIVGIFGVVTALLILSYYSVIGGWILKYFTSYITAFKAPDSFAAFTGETWQPVFFHFLFILATGLVCFFGVKGIERASKIMMPGLFLLLIVIIIRSLTLPNAGAGLSFIFSPSGSHFTLSSVSQALSQVFYSLSLCMGITITYGSYLNKKVNIPKSCGILASLDTVMAVMAGVAIFPAVFSFGLKPESGPGLIFETLPKVFESISGGSVFAILFFVLIFFAALTSAIALLEVVVSTAVTKFGWSRTKSVIILVLVAFLLGVPSSLSQGVWGEIKIFNYNFFDFAVMLTDQILLPLGGILMCYYIGWKWGPKRLISEIKQEGVKFKLARVWLFFIRYVTPVLILIITISGFTEIYKVVAG